jgi:hypothetical protein
MPSTPRRRNEGHRRCGSGAETDLFVRGTAPTTPIALHDLQNQTLTIEQRDWIPLPAAGVDEGRGDQHERRSRSDEKRCRLPDHLWRLGQGAKLVWHDSDHVQWKFSVVIELLVMGNCVVACLKVIVHYCDII